MSMPSIIFESKGSTYSLPSTNVRSIIKLPEITPIPNSASHIRGIIEYRKSLYTVVDFRIISQKQSLVEELSIFKKMLEQREKDHINWLNELEKSIIENRPFNLTTDPSKCAFGKWYDNYQSQNMNINKILFKFNEPHKKIHNIAQKIELLKSEGNFDECRMIIESTRNSELSKMKDLFSKLKEDCHLEFVESAILLQLDKKKIALTIEKVRSVEEVEKQDTQNMNKMDLIDFDENLICGLGKTNKRNMIIMLSDLNLLT